MIRDLSGKDEAGTGPRKRRRSSGAKRKRATAGAPSASGE
jgi:poly(A) polymerase